MSHLLKFIFIFCVIVAGAFYTGVRPPETLTIGPEGAEIALTVELHPNPNNAFF